MAFDTLLLDEREPGLWLLTLNRPETLNALTPPMLDEIASALRVVEAGGGRCLLVTGAGGRAFAAGADVGAMRPMSALECREFALLGHATMRAVENTPFPVIALVDGYALGAGCELALACDFIVASSKAVFGLPEVGLGICPGMGGTQRLTRVVGKSLAIELVCTGRQVSADEAQRIGLANHVVDAHDLMARGLDIARTIAARAPVAARMARRLIRHGQDIDLAHANALEVEAFAVLCSTEDRHEGMAAFAERRAARFVGR
ncbi:enoyl-CoA hydratase [Burkholderiales bacterium]|nr:enoyl-CoA hydratase [Burkholderiales bacterium]